MSSILSSIHSQRIDQQLVNIHNTFVEQNRHVVYVIIKAVKYLATQMMAIRGHNNDDGALLNLFTLLADFDPTAAAYLKQLEEIRSRENRKKPEVNR